MINHNEKKLLKKYLNNSFPQIFYNDGNEEIVFLDSFIAGYCSQLLHFSKPKNIPEKLIDEKDLELIDNNIHADGVREYKELLLGVVKIIQKESLKRK